jgi:hypothetical protein
MSGSNSVAYGGNRLLARVGWFYAVVMTLNAILHFAGSIYLDRWMPGVYSSPLLLAASAYLIASLIRRKDGPVDSTRSLATRIGKDQRSVSP